MRCAAGESEGTIDFFQHRDNHGKSSALPASAQGIKPDRQTRITVPVRPVGAILADLAIAPQEIDLIWMDIEGYERWPCAPCSRCSTDAPPFYLEFSPVFYGVEGTRSFAATLARAYERCILFHEDRLEPMRVSELPLDLPQFDLLLLP